MQETGINNRRIIIYLCLVFIFTYLYEYFFVIRYLADVPGNTIASITFRVAAAMFMPAVCAAVTRIVTHEGFRDAYIGFGIKDGKLKYYLLAWFSPAVLTLLGAIIYFIVFRDDFSLDMEYIINTYAGQGVEGLTPDVMMKTAVSQAVTAVLIGPVINCVTCFGEEWGWRGYLLPKLKERFSTLPLMVIMGLIWGVWHLPLIIAGHNYGQGYAGYPYAGIAAMTVFCFSMGTIFSYVTIYTGSCIPAVIGHGAVNAISAIGIYFTKSGGKMLFGPSPAGLIAGIPCLIFACLLIVLMNKDETKQK